jgi:hypothetical protein
MKKGIVSLAVLVSLLAAQSCGTSTNNATVDTTKNGVISSNPAPVVIPEKEAKPTQGELSEQREKTKVKFKTMKHDFGKVKAGESREFDFEFTNTGKNELFVEFAKGSCGCTVPDWPKDGIPPGEKSKIHVKFDSTGKSGKQEKTVTVIANTEPSTSTILTITADVEGTAAKPVK